MVVLMPLSVHTFGFWFCWFQSLEFLNLYYFQTRILEEKKH